MLTAIAAKDNVSATVEVKNIHLFWDNAPKYLVGCVIQKRKILFYLPRIVLKCQSSFFKSGLKEWKISKYIPKQVVNFVKRTTFQPQKNCKIAKPEYQIESETALNKF